MLSDKMIECIPTEIRQDYIPTDDFKDARPYGVRLKLHADNSYIKIIEYDASFPTLSNLTTKIRDIRKIYEDYIIEAIVLHDPKRGELMGIPSIRKKFTTSGIVIDCIDGSGKVVEHWAERDDLGLLQ